MMLSACLAIILVRVYSQRLSAVIVSPFVNGPFLDALLNARAALSLEHNIFVVTARAHQQQIDSYRPLNISFLVSLTRCCGQRRILVEAPLVDESLLCAEAAAVARKRGYALCALPQ